MSGWLIALFVAAAVAAAAAEAQAAPDWDLPDPFRLEDGSRVASTADWSRRRAEIRGLLLKHEYGAPPTADTRVTAAVGGVSYLFDGAASQRRAALTTGPDQSISMTVELTLPTGKGPHPVIVCGDACWGSVPGLQRILERGYGVAAFDRTEVDPDTPERTKGGRVAYKGEEWATISAWAWSFSRVIDWLCTVPEIDDRRIVVTGHSRGGKAALLAGALDERVAITAPNNSGCGGAAPYRIVDKGSETLEVITRAFPHWFVPGLREFKDDVTRLPFDQHFLLALVAPRGLLVTNALDDHWADPEGTQQTFLAAKEVFRYLDAGGKAGIAYRPGGHGHTEDDWMALVDFADHLFRRGKPDRKFDLLPFNGGKRAFRWSEPVG